MKIQSRYSICLSILVLLLFFSCGSAAQIPSELKGTWQVDEVHINMNSSRTVSYAWNDPRLRWRMFAFSDTQISGDAPEVGACSNPKSRTMRIKLSKLFGESLAGDGYPAQQATPAGYSLKADPSAVASVISITCRDGLWQGGLGADGGVQGAWMYITPDRHLVLRWYDETILMLTRLAADARPKASFNCNMTSSATRKVICGSQQLASFDRSVSLSYEQTRLLYKEEKGAEQRLLASQSAWVRQRNACGMNSTCLLASMKKRLDQLAAFDPD